MKRRNLLQGLLLVFGGESLHLPGPLVADAREWIDGADHAPPIESSLASGPLSEPEVETLVAFTEVLVEGRLLSPDERVYVVEHVAHRAKHGYLPLYRTTAQLLDHLAGGRFSTLDVPRRIELMARHRLTPGGKPGEQLGALAEQTRAARTRVAPDLIGGYYASPAGWTAVGYDAFPGRCGDLARYTRPHDSSRAR